MKKIPIETDEMLINLDIYPIDEGNITKKRIADVRERIRNLESEGNKNQLLKMAEYLVSIVEKWEIRDRNIIDRAVQCLQKVSSILAIEKNKILANKKNKNC